MVEAACLGGGAFCFSGQQQQGRTRGRGHVVGDKMQRRFVWCGGCFMGRGPAALSAGLFFALGGVARGGEAGGWREVLPWKRASVGGDAGRW